jgi:general secretion pathway protein L
VNRFRQLLDGVSRWIDSVAATIVAWIGHFSAPRTVQFVDEGEGVFRVQAKGVPHSADGRVRIADGRLDDALPAGVQAALQGTRAELVLQPNRFLFRPLELPRKAGEFLEGIVRAQIDRLTPWSPADAVFGWSKPADAGADRIGLTVVATAKNLITPYVQALASLGVESIAVSTAGPDSAPVRVLDQKAHGGIDVARVRRILIAVLAITGIATVATVSVATILAENLGSRQEAVARRIAERRALLRSGDSVDGATAAQRTLERRKHEALSSVIVLETLSNILPDHTYVTELRIEGDKLRVTGVTRDAPSLIRLMEQSPHFTRATFFAPTTRAPGDPGERFHIEARIESIALRS